MLPFTRYLRVGGSIPRRCVEGIAKDTCSDFVGGCRSLGIHLKREPDIGVTEATLCRLRIDTGLCEDGCTRSPKVVKLQPRKRRSFARRKPDSRRHFV